MFDFERRPMRRLLFGMVSLGHSQNLRRELTLFDIPLRRTGCESRSCMCS
jgi:hypothetical protein